MYKDKRDRFSVAAATENMIYHGPVNRDELFNTFVAIRNKKKNKIRLVAVDHVTLSPLFKGQEDLLNTTTGTTELTTSELNKQFGSKRIKRQTEQRERMKMDIENVKEQLEQTVADVKVDVQDMVAPNVDDSDVSYKPPINRNASKVEQVYVLDEIVSPSVLNSLFEEANRILEGENDKSLDTTIFITREIQKLRISTKPDKEDTCQLLLYIDCLIKFLNVQAKTVSTKSYKSCPYSDVVHNDIVNKFTVVSRGGRLRPPVMRDKCMCYILVLSMLACGYTLTLEVLAKELKIGVKKLQEVSRILAFHVSKEVAILKLPLPAPVSNIQKGKRKR